MASLAVISTMLTNAVADADELEPRVAALLASQLRSTAGASVDPSATTAHADTAADELPPPLPALDALCEALGVPTARTAAAGTAHAADRLPLRVRSGAAVGLERTMWRACMRAGVHELLTRDLVNSLASHIKATLSSGPPAAGAAPPDPAGDTRATDLPVVLELGCGSGLLAAELARRLDGTAKVVAVDDCSALISTVAAVVRMDAAAALAAYAPTMVVVAWMPSGKDWTSMIRACPTVKQYVLLGESDSSTCGDGWATWGVVPPIGCRRCQFEGCGRCDYGLDDTSVPPFRTDGFERACLDHVANCQLCRFDSAVVRGFSSTIAFTRGGPD